MSRSEYTPGPWIVARRLGCRVDGQKERTEFFSVERPDCIAGGGVALVHARHTDATAHLVAAAPELLEALGQIVSAWESIDPNELVPEEINVDDLWDAARAAIAKAKEGAA